MEPEPVSPSSPLRAALQRSALKAALVPQRPVFANPWESTEDMFACIVAVSVFNPGLLWAGGALMGALFGFSSHWSIGVFMVASLVGAAGFITIVGRERTSLAVDVLAIAAWIALGLVVAPIVGLAPPVVVSIIIYAIMLTGIFGYVLVVGHFQVAFLRSVSWPITWSGLAIFFAFAADHLILYH
ncbi:MAG: hypothetical protein ACRDMX_05905 [Solirubrobacteraceae bacterium]